ncbi:GTP binding protein [Aureococcus anophagefferens]|nr:GTP binding protein [Aureococcus anophagefferens]
MVPKFLLFFCGAAAALVAPHPKRACVAARPSVALPDADVAAVPGDGEADRPPELEASGPAPATLATPFRAGFVGVVGSPNVGKSTLTNALLGQDLCITNSKAQTTRHRILGVANGDGYQLVLSDTPGILCDPAYALQSTMMTAAKAAARDAECVLFVTDVFEDPEVVAESAAWLDAQLASRAGDEPKPPVVVALNKVDLLGVDDDGYPLLGEAASRRLPESAALFDDEYFTDRPSRFFAAEIIREKILAQFAKEIPYSCEVRIDRFKEDLELKGRPFVNIDAAVLVARDSQKGILVGKRGAAIKAIGVAAREHLETFFDAKVHLALRVKVSKDWRADEGKLKAMGYPVAGR